MKLSDVFVGVSRTHAPEGASFCRPSGRHIHIIKDREPYSMVAIFSQHLMEA